MCGCVRNCHSGHCKALFPGPLGEPCRSPPGSEGAGRSCFAPSQLKRLPTRCRPHRRSARTRGLGSLARRSIGAAQEVTTLPLDANGRPQLPPGAVTETAYVIDAFAGTGEERFHCDGGPATQARFHTPRGIAVDAGGNIYVTERGVGIEYARSTRRAPSRRLPEQASEVTPVTGGLLQRPSLTPRGESESIGSARSSWPITETTLCARSTSWEELPLSERTTLYLIRTAWPWTCSGTCW